MKRSISGIACSLIVFWAWSCTDQPGQDYQVRTDMKSQPSFRHNRDPLPPAEGTVQAAGYEMPLGDSAEAAGVRNPYTFSRTAEDTAKTLFETYCFPCHGIAAKGDGPVAVKFQMPPDLTTPHYAMAPDGYIYRVIRYGIRIMPPQGENTSARDRWLIIMHLRELQRQ